MNENFFYDRDKLKGYRINPAFDRHPDEAKLIGLILASFGEIELMVCKVAGTALGSEETVVRAFYRLRMTSARLEMANVLAGPVFTLHGLEQEYETLAAGMNRALKIRNQYAHCNWADHQPDESAGLFFADVQEAAKATTGLVYAFKHVDSVLLTKQYHLLVLLIEWMFYLDNELSARMGRIGPHNWPKPPEFDLPPLHNPEEKHIPPWLTEDQKALHLARALAAKGGPPTPTPGQQEQDRLRSAKRVRQEAQRQSARNGDAKQRTSPDPTELNRE